MDIYKITKKKFRIKIVIDLNNFSLNLFPLFETIGSQNVSIPEAYFDKCWNELTGYCIWSVMAFFRKFANPPTFSSGTALNMVLL